MLYVWIQKVSIPEAHIRHNSMKKIYTEQLEILLRQMKELEAQHPKAQVFYDVERGGIQVLYPLPKDFFTLKSVKFTNEDL